MKWTSIADQGECRLLVMSGERAARAGIPLHPEAVLIGILTADGVDAGTPIGFTSIDSLKEFVSEMRLREITVADEDPTAVAALRTDTVH